MVIDLNVNKDDDGYTSVVPSISGCESWAPKEDEAIIKAVELVRFYLDLPDKTEIKIDKARSSKNKVIYKLIFDKS